MELLAALDEVGIPIHEEFIWLHIMDNLPPGYKFIKNNLQGSNEPLTCIVLEDALWRKYCAQSGGNIAKAILDPALFVSGSKAGRGSGRGGGHAGTNKGKLNSRGRSERLSLQVKLTCIPAKSPGTFDFTVPSTNASSAGSGVTRWFSAHLRFRLRTRMKTRRRSTSQLLRW